MRRHHLTACVSAALLTGALLAGCSDDNDDPPAGATEPPADETTNDPDTGHEPPAGAGDVTPELAVDVAAMRAGTAAYADDLDAALADGYFVITQHMPDQGYHFLNPDIEGFDPSRPPIIMYAKDGDDWQLVGFEWVFPEEPDEPPLDGATYGSFPAACHYDDGLFVEAAGEEDCDQAHPDSGAAFTFWHPDLVTLHVWAWLHNPEGLYHPTNPLMGSYNQAGTAEAGSGHEGFARSFTGRSWAV